MNHLSNWEKDLQSRLANHEVTPSPMGWEQLQKALEAKKASANEKGTITKKPRKHLFTLWLTTATAAAAACLVLTFLTHTATQPKETDSLAKQVIPSSPTNQPNETTGAPHLSNTTKLPSTPTNHPLLAQAQPQSLSKIELPTATSTSQLTASESTLKTDRHTTDSVVEQQVLLAETSSPSSPTSSIEEEEVPTSTLSKHQADKADRIATYLAQKQQQRPKKQLLSLNLLASTSIGSNTSQLGYLLLTSTSAPSNGLPYSDNKEGEELEGMPTVMGANFNQYVNSKVNHKMPVQLGLSLNIPLHPRWSLTTGVTYTKLSSDLQSGTEVAYYATEQSLHYVGIPLQMNYTLLTSRIVNLYMGAGAAIEKCVKGVQRTEYIVNNNYHATTPEVSNLGKGLWQASMGAAAGIQLNLTSQLGIYVEPGLRYYLPDGSSLPNIRHDKPVNFSLQMGLRLSPFK